MSVTTNIIRPPMAETLEHIRVVTRLPEWHWCDLLNISWTDYQQFKAGRRKLSKKSIENISREYPLSIDTILSNQVDFTRLALALEDPKRVLPERYSKAAFGRTRASLSSMEFLEKKYGWRLRTAILHWLDIPESKLVNPFSPVSIHLMDDICEYMHRRSLTSHDIFMMGVHSYEAARNTLVGRILSELKSVQEVYECFFSEAIQIYEENCRYLLVRMDADGALIEMRPNPDAASELRSRLVGNKYICQYKLGHFASLPLYVNEPLASVRELSCAHEGDDCCRFEARFQLKSPSQMDCNASL